MERTAVFIDAGYLNRVLKELELDPKIDLVGFSELVCKLTGNASRFRSYYYDCMPYQSSPPTDEEKDRYARKDRFIGFLRKSKAFEIRLGRLSRTETGFTQKMVDILLSIDLTTLSTKGAIQRAILVTGDSDFVPAIKKAKDEGVYVHLFHGKKHDGRIHNELYDACDERTELTQDILQKLLLPSHQQKTPQSNQFINH